MRTSRPSGRSFFQLLNSLSIRQRLNMTSRQVRRPESPDVVDRAIGELDLVDQVELMPLLPIPDEDVLEEVEVANACWSSPDLLLELARDRLFSGLAELNSASERYAMTSPVVGS